MIKKMLLIAVGLPLAVISQADSALSGGYFTLPPLPPPDQYGNLLIDRTASKDGVKPALFSHWLHRRKYTCRVCHTELDFAMQRNATEISEAGNRAGRFCGACHNGKTAFSQEECSRCHNGNVGYGRERFSELSKLPKSGYGNRINWVKAFDKGMIAPAGYLKSATEGLQFDKTLLLEAEWNFVPPARFPHKVHTKWLDCNNCHPDIFNIKKKTTKHFSMDKILKGEFCGVCHKSVAFPMNDCRRCHPGLENS